MVPGRYEVWLCQFSHRCANATNAMCFVFDEVQQEFVPWGLNSELRLVQGGVFDGVELTTSVVIATLKQTQADLQASLSALQTNLALVAEQTSRNAEQTSRNAEKASHDAQLAFLAGGRCPANSLNAASASSVFECDCPANSYLSIGYLTVQCTPCPNGTFSPHHSTNASF